MIKILSIFSKRMDLISESIGMTVRWLVFDYDGGDGF